jgi:7,8-dihydropterin-6-yl-methyl-4-(beta-D-ribofuranosyl)aminobenzene 5'-phosphate synthase
MTEQVHLLAVESVDVTILVDNSLDILMPNEREAQRPPLVWDWSERDQLRAEHGYALLVTVTSQGRKASLLYDAGLGRDTVLHNMDVLGLDPTDIRAIVLSHGHADHHGGLEGIVRRIGRTHLPLTLHPDAWLQRKVIFPTGTEIRMPPPSHNDLDREDVVILEERGPSLLIDDTILVTGQVERTTAFEQGFPLQYKETDHGWELDRWIWDDQGIVLRVGEKGLVILSSCSHAGVINVIRHAQRLTGIEQIYGFIGGMHLTGGLFEGIIPQTVAAMQAIQPQVLVPGHCTGWKAVQAMAQALPGAYLHPGVGTRFRFVAEG